MGLPDRACEIPARVSWAHRKHAMAIAAALAAALGSILLIAAVSPETTAAPTERRFEFSRSPDEVIISVLYSGGLSSRDLSVRLFGDGRLLIEEVRNADSVVVASWTGRLLEPEVEALLRDAIDGRLMEYDAESVRAQKRALNRSEPARIDMPGTFVEIRLVGLEDATGAWVGPVSRRIAAMNVSLSAELFPEIRELAALSRVLKALTSEYLSAKKGTKP